MKTLRDSNVAPLATPIDTQRLAESIRRRLLELAADDDVGPEMAGALTLIRADVGRVAAAAAAAFEELRALRAWNALTRRPANPAPNDDPRGH